MYVFFKSKFLAFSKDFNFLSFSNLNFNLIKFAKLISKLSKTQVIIIKNYNELVKYFKKNLMSSEIIIGMGAGSISKWMRDLKDSI